MNIKPHQEEILQQYRTQESLLSRLYSIFAGQFPEYKEFWEKLSLEEDKHARLLEKLSRAAAQGVVLFDEGNIKSFALETFIKGLNALIEKAEKGEIKALQAFTLASDYETSLIEKNVFSRFVALNEKSKTILNALKAETLEHIERVKKVHKEACLK